MTRIKPPPPGVYTNIPAHEYHAWDLPSQSSLKNILPPGTPQDYKHQQENPKLETADMILGHGIHSHILDDVPIEKFTIAPWKTACKAYHAFAGEHEGKHIILEGQDEKLREMRKAFDEHYFAPSLRKAADHIEVSIVFEYAGLLMKARLDLCISKSGVVADLKKTTEGGGHEDSFSGAVTEYGYHIQAATYMQAATHIPDFVPEQFYFVTLEDGGTFKVNCLLMDDFDMQLGRGQLLKAIDIYKDCTDTGIWSGYSTDRVQTARLRGWRRQKLITELDQYLTDIGVPAVDPDDQEFS